MTRYRVTATLNEKQIIDEVEAVSEDSAWTFTNTKHDNLLYNGLIEELPTRAELAAQIAQLREALEKLDKLTAQKVDMRDQWDRGWYAALKQVNKIFAAARALKGGE